MMTTPAISVIIPIYNTERYLRRCIDSVIAQSFRDIEIILVDDGSPDKAGSIADEYAERYDNISVIHKKNEGLAEARRTGIAAAHGEYIMHVDSDDTIPHDAIQFLHEKCKAEKLDIAYGSFNRYVNGVITRTIGHPSERILNREEFTAYLVSPRCICASWGCISRKCLWDNPVFPKIVFPSEDVLINIKLSRYVNKVGIYHHPVYNYSYNPSSLSITGKFYTQSLWATYFQEIESELKDRGLLDELLNGLNMLKINVASFFVRPIDISQNWVKEAIECDTSKMPMKLKLLQRLVKHPQLLDFLIKSNRIVKKILGISNH
jgi:glycosyltransferase involved in cell wall biosynthesis